MNLYDYIIPAQESVQKSGFEQMKDTYKKTVW